MTQINKKAGFTLIELLVVISIVLLVTGAGIAGFINFNDRQQVLTKAKEIQALMRSAQVKARAGEGADVCRTMSPERVFKGYRVALQADGAAVLLSRICVLPNGTGESPALRTSLVLGNDVNVTMIKADGNSGRVNFLALRGGVQILTGDSESLTITISKNNTHYQFQVLNTGEITEGTFQ